MELVFQTHNMSYLKQILHEIRYQDETAETIVPDSYPDMEGIIDSFASAVLRSKECRNGSASISGGIKGGILYRAEGSDQIKKLDYYLPFHLKLDHPDLTSNSKICCDVRIRSVDGKIINSRKAMLRVNLSCMVMGYEPTEETCYDLLERPDCLQVLERKYPLHLPLEVEEKMFTIHDSMELEAGAPDIAEIYQVICHPVLTDQKIVGDKMAFRGNTICKILYLSEDGRMHLHEFSVPFSQYCRFEETYDDEIGTVLLVMTGYDLILEGKNPTRRGEIEIHILGQCIVQGMRELTVIEDAYSTDGTFKAKWKQYHIDSCLDQQRTAVTVHQQMSKNIHEILYSELYTDFPMISNESGKIICTVSTTGHTIGYDVENRLEGAVGIGCASIQNPDCGQARSIGWAVQNGNTYATNSGSITELHQEMIIEMQYFGAHKIAMLCGGEIDTESENVQRTPSLILKRADSETTLWELAKSCKSRVEAICEINSLDKNWISDDQMLLIPIG